MKALLPDQGSARAAIMGSSLKKLGPVSKKKLSKEIDALLTDTIRQYTEDFGGVLHLPTFFKSVLKARIMKMMLEQKSK